MFRYATLIVIFTLILSGCNSSTPVPTSVQPTRSLTKTPFVKPTSTKTQVPTSTITPLPSPTITPMSEGHVSPHKLALNEERAATEMIRLARYGQGTLFDIEWSPDGKYLAVATGLGVYFYDANTLEQVDFFDINDDATVIAFNPEGTFLAIARQTFVEIWDVRSARKINQLDGGINGGIWALTFGTNGYIAAIGQIEKGLGETTPQLKVWQAITGQLLFSRERGSDFSVAIDISADGKTILFDYKGMAIHNIQTIERMQELNGDLDAIFSPDGKKIFTVESTYEGFEEKFRIWMTPISSRNAALILKDSVCNRLSRNGNFTICHGEKSVVLFDPKNGSAIKTFEFSNPPLIDDAEISSDGKFLAIERGDLVTIFDIQTEQEIKSLYFDSFQNFATSLITLDQVERYVAGVSVQDGLIRILDLSSGNVLREFRTSDQEVTGLTFSPDGLTLASVDKKGILQLWNLQNGVSTHKFGLGGKHVSGPLVFSADGLKLAMTNKSQEYTFEFDLQSGEIRKIADNPSPVIYAYPLHYGWYLPTDGGNWVSWEQKEESKFFTNLTTGQSIQLPFNPGEEFSFLEAIALNPEGNILAIGSTNTKIEIWDWQNQNLIQTLLGHSERQAHAPSGAIRHLAFNPQTNLLVSVGWDGTTRLWDIHTGRQLRLLEVCCRADFSPDGRLLITEGNGVIRVWGVPPWP